MGTSGTYVVADGAPAGLEVERDVRLGGPWHCYVVREVLVPGGDHASLLSDTVLAVGNVLDSDYCRVVGIDAGKVAWNWEFGEAPWATGVDEDEAAGHRMAAAKLAAAEIARWAARRGVAVPEVAALADVLDHGDAFAEDGFFRLLEALGLPATPSPALVGVIDAGKRQTAYAYPGPDRCLLLQVNTPSDLFDHLGAVATWLDSARRVMIKPLMASFPAERVRTGIGAHERLVGPPDGLLVTSGGWSVKNRPVFGGGDERGWATKLRQLTQGKLREIDIQARPLDADGRLFGGPGGVEIRAVLRDQFVQQAAAPLPPEHPGQLSVRVSAGLFERVVGFDVVAALQELGEDAVRTLPDSSGFLDPARPSIHGPKAHLTPGSPLAWCSPPGSYRFDPSLIVGVQPDVSLRVRHDVSLDVQPDV